MIFSDEHEILIKITPVEEI